MKLIANKLGVTLGSKVLLVSVTIDPEHDRPARLFSYARAFEANINGWYFLTGSPSQIDQLLNGFRLTRKRESDGTVDHIIGYFLVGPDGHPMLEYAGTVHPAILARDAENAVGRKTLLDRWSLDVRDWI
jgi:protein SCO1